jgi:RNA polymerase sigma-70 factor (ECF subfamily)
MPKDASFDNKGKVVTALTDNVLLERIGRGDVASFETLFYRHYDRVYGLLFRLLGNRVEAEDVTQEVFLKLYRQPLQKGLSGGREHNVSAWLYRVAMNMGYNHIRSQKRRWQRNTWLVPDATDALPGPAERAAQQETEVLASQCRLLTIATTLMPLALQASANSIGTTLQPLDEITSAASCSLTSKLRRMRSARPDTFSRNIACRWPLAPTTLL